MTKKEELEAQGYKTYENEDIQVFWKPRICQHAGECARGNYNVARQVTIGEHKLNVSISAGFARCPEDGTKFEEVVKKADERMYQDKKEIKAKRAAQGIISPRDLR